MERPRPLHDALWHYYCDFDAIGLIREFAVGVGEPESGLVTNFLGTRIEPAVHPPVLAALAGTVEGLPLPGNWHADIAEWAAALLAVRRASGRFRIVELGCGWGCWMVNTGVAARRRGLAVDLIGIEGEARHLANARRTLELNGFGEDDFTLIHGVAGPTPGEAIFPKTTQGHATWGGAAIFDPSPEQLDAARQRDDVQVLQCYTLGQMSQEEPIDLLHIDIQGAEAEFVPANLDQMARFVRHVLIGTHSRVIEGRLIDVLRAGGWDLEMERPAVMTVKAGRQNVVIDGVQMWRNQKLGQ